MLMLPVLVFFAGLIALAAATVVGLGHAPAREWARAREGARPVAEPVRVGDLLVEMPGLADWLAEARLVAAWPTIAGPAGARSRAGGRGTGRSAGRRWTAPGWLHRLTLEEPRLIARCREIAAIRAIRFRLAPPPDAAARAARNPLPAVEGEVRS